MGDRRRISSKPESRASWEQAPSAGTRGLRSRCCTAAARPLGATEWAATDLTVGRVLSSSAAWDRARHTQRRMAGAEARPVPARSRSSRLPTPVHAARRNEEPDHEQADRRRAHRPLRLPGGGGSPRSDLPVLISILARARDHLHMCPRSATTQARSTSPLSSARSSVTASNGSAGTTRAGSGSRLGRRSNPARQQSGQAAVSPAQQSNLARAAAGSQSHAGAPPGALQPFGRMSIQ